MSFSWTEHTTTMSVCPLAGQNAQRPRQYVLQLDRTHNDHVSMSFSWTEHTTTMSVCPSAGQNTQPPCQYVLQLDRTHNDHVCCVVYVYQILDSILSHMFAAGKQIANSRFNVGNYVCSHAFLCDSTAVYFYLPDTRPVLGLHPQQLRVVVSQKGVHNRQHLKTTSHSPAAANCGT